MTPEQLKLSILQSAFQGKLTGECLPNETADDLYQQIQSEKQRLISEKKIKKEKPLPEISADEIPFDIPDNWRWCYVGDLFLHNTGKAQNSSGSTNGTIRKFITTSNLYWGGDVTIYSLPPLPPRVRYTCLPLLSLISRSTSYPHASVRNVFSISTRKRKGKNLSIFSSPADWRCISFLSLILISVATCIPAFLSVCKRL